WRAERAAAAGLGDLDADRRQRRLARDRRGPFRARRRALLADEQHDQEREDRPDRHREQAPTGARRLRRDRHRRRERDLDGSVERTRASLADRAAEREPRVASGGPLVGAEVDRADARASRRARGVRQLAPRQRPPEGDATGEEPRDALGGLGLAEVSNRDRAQETT